MLDKLPATVLDNVYSWLTLSNIRKTTRKLSKRHRIFSIRRLVAAIDGLRVSLDTDLNSKHYDYDWNHRFVVLARTRNTADGAPDMIRFHPDIYSTRWNPLFVSGVELAATKLKIVIYEDPYEGGMHAKLFNEPYPEIVALRHVGEEPLVFPPCLSWL
ncbi:hypothetical protein HDU98_011259 [Podochytrium sp. JEL0797]|nr:hypothetical protein HDU98_011259 [Podochytrium sp. JEL0797]